MKNWSKSGFGLFLKESKLYSEGKQFNYRPCQAWLFTYLSNGPEGKIRVVISVERKFWKAIKGLIRFLNSCKGRAILVILGDLGLGRVDIGIK